MSRKLQIGDVVRCVDGGEAVVIDIYRNIPGGVRLNRYVQDFKSWNEDELTFLRHASQEWLNTNGFWYLKRSK